jgi:hypothetical protein
LKKYLLTVWLFLSVILVVGDGQRFIAIIRAILGAQAVEFVLMNLPEQHWNNSDLWKPKLGTYRALLIFAMISALLAFYWIFQILADRDGRFLPAAFFLLVFGLLCYCCQPALVYISSDSIKKFFTNALDLSGWIQTHVPKSELFSKTIPSLPDLPHADRSDPSEPVDCSLT